MPMQPPGRVERGWQAKGEQPPLAELAGQDEQPGVQNKTAREEEARGNSSTAETPSALAAVA